jgi:hypothetical protein
MFKIKTKVTSAVAEVDAKQYFKKYVNDPTTTMHEVLHKTVVKPYFDYDEIVASQEQIDKLRLDRIKKIHNIMKWYFADGEIIHIFEASGYNPVKKVWKLSFRVIIQNHGVYASGKIILDNIIPELNRYSEHKKYNIEWDTSVYKDKDKMQLILLPYHCKERNERFFRKLNLAKNNYPCIEKSSITAKEFASYFIQNPMSTEGRKLEEKYFEVDSGSDTEESTNNICSESQTIINDTYSYKDIETLCD